MNHLTLTYKIWFHALSFTIMDAHEQFKIYKFSQNALNFPFQSYKIDVLNVFWMISLILVLDEGGGGTGVKMSKVFHHKCITD
jgi:hypothetical protein